MKDDVEGCFLNREILLILMLVLMFLWEVVIV